MKAGQKVWSIVGDNSLCFDRDENGGGLACVDEGKKKMYQVDIYGSSVAKLNAKKPEKFDRETERFKVKDLSENCRVTTANEGTKDETTVAMCYKENTPPFFTDMGDNLEEMDKKLDEIAKDL